MRHVDERKFAPAAGRNRGPIREVLEGLLPSSGRVLEVGSGTGEHIVFFAASGPGLIWQPSDPDPEARASIAAWIAESGLNNVRPPLDLDVCAPSWPVESGVELIVSINTIHIAPWETCLGLLAGAGRLLAPEGHLFLYGPFRIGGRHTAPSNAQFDASLRVHSPAWGVRDLEAVTEAAAAHGLLPAERVAMPANNFSVVFRRD